MNCPRCDSKDTVGMGCVGMDAMKYECMKCEFEWKDWTVKFIDPKYIKYMWVNGRKVI